MVEMHLPWLELSILIPLLGAAWIGRLRNPEVAQRDSVVIAAVVLACTLGAWFDFGTLHTFEAHDRGNLVSPLLGEDALVIDELSAPLLPLAALLYFSTIVATLRTKVRRFPFAWTLVSEAILLATLSWKEPWGVIVLLTAHTVPPLVELRARKKPVGVYLSHMVLFAGLMLAGWAMVSTWSGRANPSTWGLLFVLGAVLLRSGIAPLHCWMTDLFEHASFGTALLFVTPMAGAYAAMRLVLPIAPGWALRTVAMLSLLTAVYAAGMALVQSEARRFFCYLFLSHSALVLVGLDLPSPIGLTGALCVWLSIGLSLAGFGLTLRSLEARTGRLSLQKYHGLYEHTPTLAAFFLLTGLASVGFPGTVGFVGTELLVDGTVQTYPLVGMAVVFAAALNGIAIVLAYLRLFTGTQHTASLSLRSRLPERFTVLTLTALILGGGLYPQPGVASRYHAAMAMLRTRQDLGIAQTHRRKAGDAVAEPGPGRDLGSEQQLPPPDSSSTQVSALDRMQEEPTP